MFLASLLACVGLLADLPPDLQRKVDHAIKRRAELVARYETLLAQPEQSFNRDLQRDAKVKLADLRAGGVPDIKVDVQTAKPGDFGAIANRRLIVVQVVDDSTAIVAPIVNSTSAVILGGGGGQVVKASPGRQVVLRDFPTAGMSPGQPLSPPAAVEVLDSQPVAGKSLPVIRPFDMLQLKPHLPPLK